MYDDFQVNKALETIGYLIYILPKLLCYESTTEYEDAFNIIKKYIKYNQEIMEDDLK